MKASGECGISGARPLHSAQTMGAARECFGGRAECRHLAPLTAKGARVNNCGGAKDRCPYYLLILHRKNAGHRCISRAPRALSPGTKSGAAVGTSLQVAHNLSGPRWSFSVKRKPKTSQRTAQLEGALAYIWRPRGSRPMIRASSCAGGELIARAAMNGKAAA